MIGAKEKKERALGMKLFLKGHRCNSPKCAAVRRPQRPGMHGKKRRRAMSEFGQQLMEKQRVKVSYGLREAQLLKIVKAALKKPGAIGETIINLLETQLVNVVFRAGIAPSRIIARQFVGHGHIFVNGEKVTIPSYRVKAGDIIAIKPSSKELLLFKELSSILKKYEPPHWVELDKEKLEAKIKSLPENVEIPFDINLVVDYYSK